MPYLASNSDSDRIVHSLIKEGAEQTLAQTAVGFVSGAAVGLVLVRFGKIRQAHKVLSGAGAGMGFGSGWTKTSIAIDDATGLSK